MRSLPRSVVVKLIFTLECGGVTGSVPELRLFHMYGVNAHVHHPFERLCDIVRKSYCGHHVGRVFSVIYNVSVSVGLRLVPVFSAVIFAGEIVEITPPGYACHEMNDNVFFSESLYAFGQGFIVAVYHDKITVDIGSSVRKFAYLKACAFFAVASDE